MPYIYQVYVEYYDEDDNRFWFDTEQVSSPVPLSQSQVFNEVDLLIAQKISGPQYESLRDYVATETYEPVERITAAYFVPP